MSKKAPHHFIDEWCKEIDDALKEYEHEQDRKGNHGAFHVPGNVGDDGNGE